ncbi:MAG: hypothetical protein Q7S53_05265 [bacterium]|nr:hypothetical protein [bacterium]
MNETSEINLDESYDELSDELSVLKESFVLALDEGDMQKAAGLKEEIEPYLSLMQEELGMPLEKEREEAQEVMKGDYLGPEAIEKALGVRIERKNIPKIPFSKEDLEIAKKCGQFLILRVDKEADGEPLTMPQISWRYKERKGRSALHIHEAFHDSNFVNKETPSVGWALVTVVGREEPIDISFQEETELLIDHLQSNIFKGRKLPEVYEEAIQEYEEMKSEIERANVPHSNYLLSRLKINNLLRPKPVDILYDAVVSSIVRGKRIYGEWGFRTGEASQGEIMAMGFFENPEMKIGGVHDENVYGLTYSRRI